MFLVGTYISGILYIDWDEAPGMIKALKYQINLLDTKPTNNVSYRYSTTNGVVGSCSYATTSSLGVNSGWKFSFERVYKFSREQVSGSELIIKKKDLSDIIGLLEKAINTNY